MKSSSSSSSHHNNNDGYHGSIILEYANANANANANREYEEKPIAYNEPHMIHLDTALFQNKRASNLIEISSDSEDTTDSESTTSDDSASSSTSHESASGSSNASDDDTVSDCELNMVVVEPEPAPEPAPEIKMVTVDLGLGAIQDFSSINDANPPSSPPDRPPIDVLTMLCKKAGSCDDDELGLASIEIPNLHTDADADTATAAAATATATATATTASTGNTAGNSVTNHSITGLSVTELRILLKEKYKQQPEKHAEIQKMKKGELIQALQAQ